MAELKKKVEDGRSENKNDPWQPMPNVQTIPVLPQPAFTSPLENIITPERYIESLEKRLNKLKGKNQKNPTSKEMLASLSQAKDDSLSHLIASGTGIRDLSETFEEKDKVPVSDLQKRMYLDCKTAVTEEMVILVRDDILQKNLKTVEQEEQVTITPKSS